MAGKDFQSFSGFLFANKRHTFGWVEVFLTFYNQVLDNFIIWQEYLLIKIADCHVGNYQHWAEWEQVIK